MFLAGAMFLIIFAVIEYELNISLSCSLFTMYYYEHSCTTITNRLKTV